MFRMVKISMQSKDRDVGDKKKDMWKIKQFIIIENLVNGRILEKKMSKNFSFFEEKIKYCYVYIMKGI